VPVRRRLGVAGCCGIGHIAGYGTGHTVDPGTGHTAGTAAETDHNMAVVAPCIAPVDGLGKDCSAPALASPRWEGSILHFRPSFLVDRKDCTASVEPSVEPAVEPAVGRKECTALAPPVASQS